MVLCHLLIVHTPGTSGPLAQRRARALDGQTAQLNLLAPLLEPLCKSLGPAPVPPATAQSPVFPPSLRRLFPHTFSILIVLAPPEVPPASRLSPLTSVTYHLLPCALDQWLALTAVVYRSREPAVHHRPARYRALLGQCISTDYIHFLTPTHIILGTSVEAVTIGQHVDRSYPATTSCHPSSSRKGSGGRPVPPAKGAPSSRKTGSLAQPRPVRSFALQQQLRCEERPFQLQ